MKKAEVKSSVDGLNNRIGKRIESVNWKKTVQIRSLNKRDNKLEK